LSFVVSHISQKTSEIWATRHWWKGQIEKFRLVIHTVDNLWIQPEKIRHCNH
jgi:hypothetical protein